MDDSPKSVLRSHSKRAVGWVRRVLTGLVMYPVKSALLIVHSVLALVTTISTAILVGYFVLTTTFTGADLLRILNTLLQGRFSATFLNVDLVAQDVQIFGLEVADPEGSTVITAEHVDTGIDLVALGLWALRDALGVPAALPLNFPATEVSGFSLSLLFDDTGVSLERTFKPRKEPEGPGGGMKPVLQFGNVVVRKGRVELVHKDWRMDAEVRLVPASMRIEDDQVFIGAKDIRIGRFRMQGKVFPAPLSFLGDRWAGVWVKRFQMSHTRMEAEGVRVTRPDLTAVVDMAMDVSRPGVPASGRGDVELHDPTILEKLSGGRVFGTAKAQVRLRGQLERPNLEATVSSPSVLVDGLQFEDVAATASVNTAEVPPVLVVPKVEAWHAGEKVELTAAKVEIGTEPALHGDVCFGWLSPAEMAESLGVSGLEAVDDAVVSGCVTGVSLSVKSAGVALVARSELAVRPGGLAGDLSGVSAALVEGPVQVSASGASWSELTLTTDVGALESSGTVSWNGAPVLDATFGLLVPRLEDVGALARVPALSALGVGGEIDIEYGRVIGPLDDPRVKVRANLDHLRLLGNRLGYAGVDAGYEGGRLDFRQICLQSSAIQGCLAATADLAATAPEIPVRLRVSRPVSFDLSALPFVELPLTGTGSVVEASLDATLSADPESIVASISGIADATLNDLAVGPLTVGDLHVRIEKAPGELAGATGAGLNAQVAFQHLVLDDTSVEWGDAQLALDRFAPPEEGAIFPKVAGTGVVRLLRVRNGPHWLSAFSVVIDAFDDPGRIDLTGAGNLYRKVGVNFKGSVDTEKEMATVKASVDRVSLALVPFFNLEERTKAMLKPTRLSGAVTGRGIDIRALADRDVRKFLKALRLEGSLLLIGLSELPEPADKLVAQLSATGGSVTLTKAQLDFLNGTKVKASGTIRPSSMSVKGNLSVSSTKLSSLKTVAAAGLPVDAVVSVKAEVSGPVERLDVVSTVSVRDLVAGEFELGSSDILVAGTVGDELKLASPSFFSGFSLLSGIIKFADRLPSGVDLEVGFADVDLRRFVPAVPPTVLVTASGKAGVALDFREGEEPFRMALDLPDGKVQACVQVLDYVPCLVNAGPAQVVVTSRAAEIRKLDLAGGGHTMSANGTIDFANGWAVRAALSIDLARIPLLSDWLASYAGTIVTEGDGIMVTGETANPDVDGALLLKEIAVLPRNFGSEVTVDQARIAIMGGLGTGNLVVLIEEDSPAVGSLEEGQFAVNGWFRLMGYKPKGGLFSLSGRELFYHVPGQYELVVSPRIELELLNLDQGEKATSRLTGEIFVAEGEYSRNFDRLLGSFESAFSRSQERYSKPITEVLPFLKSMQMDLAVEGGNFAVASRFPFGETELTVNLDLKVAGTLDDLKLYDRLTLVPGGTITYKVVKREFEVTLGTVDFTGNPATPYLDIEARTNVDYRPQSLGSYATAIQQQQFMQGIPVVIHLSGVYPDITPTFSSPDHPEYDTADLQMLLLLGMTRADLEGQTDTGSSRSVSINILTDDVAGLVSKLVLAPFVDAVSLGLTNDGGFRAEAATRVGRAMQLTTKVQQGGSTQEYSAGFVFRITDRLTLEGAMKSSQDKTGEQQETYKSYEGKFRYTVPLE